MNCPRCLDFGLWLTPQGIIAECPKLQLRLNDHAPLSAVAEIVRRAGLALARRDYRIIRRNDFVVAQLICEGTPNAPVSRQRLLHRCEWTGSQQVRHLHAAVEELRGEWHLPIGSRKSEPYGYWMCRTSAEMQAWARSAWSAPVKQIRNIRNAMKANFPELLTQPEFDFVAEFVGEEVAR